jgi:tripartite-type tricarboxylate transporter receptor subunit TctC
MNPTFMLILLVEVGSYVAQSDARILAPRAVAAAGEFVYREVMCKSAVVATGRRVMAARLRGYDTLGFLACLVMVTLPIVSTGAQAQPYPVKPVRIMVPYPPGGTPDIQMRMMTDHLTQRRGQPFVVDNRGGASGAIAMEIVARAQPDGYTLLIGTVGNWTVNPHLFRLSFDVVRDFTPIILLATTPAVLIVHPSVPAHSVKELIALAQKNPGALNTTWSTIGGPARLPAPITGRLNREMNAVLQMPDVRDRLAAMGSTVTGGAPVEAAAILKSELAKYGKLIAEAGIRPATGIP